MTDYLLSRPSGNRCYPISKPHICVGECEVYLLVCTGCLRQLLASNTYEVRTLRYWTKNNCSHCDTMKQCLTVVQCMPLPWGWHRLTKSWPIFGLQGREARQIVASCWIHISADCFGTVAYMTRLTWNPRSLKLSKFWSHANYQMCYLMMCMVFIFNSNQCLTISLILNQRSLDHFELGMGWGT